MSGKKNVAEIYLPYFKQECDLSQFLCEPNRKQPYMAFQKHSDLMQAVSRMLSNISEIVKKYPQDKINVEADTHFIGIEGPEELITELIDCSLGSIPDWTEEEKEEAINDSEKDNQ